MGVRSVETGAPKEKFRQSFTVPAVSGNYANERITFGQAQAGMIEGAYREIMALVEGSNANPFVPGVTVELWLKRMPDGTEAASAATDADYTLAGSNFATMTVAGGILWLLTGWAGAQIRVKSGGFPGTQWVSAAGF